MRKFISIFVIIFAFAAMFAGCSHQEEARSEPSRMKTITITELAEKVKTSSSEQTVLIDVREPNEFADGHIDGMVNVPLSTLADNYTTVPKDAEVVIICRSGNRSAQAADFLLKQGYSNVVNVEGGMLEWDGPVVK